MASSRVGRVERWVSRAWYADRPNPLLVPPALLFAGVTGLRRVLYRLGILRSTRVSVPVLVVGNITVGGSGKTPLVTWLVAHARTMGLRPGIVSRGYGGEPQDRPVDVGPGSDPGLVGDEPVLLAQVTGAPVCVCRRRALAAARLADSVDLVIADDGLQHYALARDAELAVVDGSRGLGNGWRLPAGPLRESPRRLASVDQIVYNGSTDGMTLVPVRWSRVADPRSTRPLAELPLDAGCWAVAGIGNPQRFFEEIERVAPGIVLKRRAFPDHWRYRPSDFDALGSARVVMTTKDAVKCRAFAGTDWWALETEARLAPPLVDALDALLRRLAASRSPTGPS